MVAEINSSQGVSRPSGGHVVLVDRERHWLSNRADQTGALPSVDVTDTPSLVLSGSPHRWGLVALGCGLLVLLGATIGLSGHYVLVGWSIAVAFAALAVIALQQPARPDHLVLNDHSFDIVHLDTAVTRDFASCSEFGVWREGTMTLVVFDHPTDDASPNAAANRAITGRSGSLPHRFGVRAEELAQLLNMARTRATQPAELDPEPHEETPGETTSGETNSD